MRAEVGFGQTRAGDGGLARGAEARQVAVKRGLTYETTPQPAPSARCQISTPTWSAARAHRPRSVPTRGHAYTAAQLHTAAEPLPHPDRSAPAHSPGCA